MCTCVGKLLCKTVSKQPLLFCSVEKVEQQKITEVEGEVSEKKKKKKKKTEDAEVGGLFHWRGESHESFLGGGYLCGGYIGIRGAVS